MRKSTHRLPGLILSNHEFILPLDHKKPNAEKITVFAREVVSVEHENKADLPWLVFFQGGPGFPAPRPDSKTGWLKRALKEYRVLLLDQRGTGLSTPATFQTLAKIESPQQQADYLKNFRADAIVADVELIRRDLIGAGNRWSGLGQSYGGFCLTHYLSAAPEGLNEAIITGGLPPVSVSVDDVYRATYRRVLEKNRRFFARYPEDQPPRGAAQRIRPNFPVLDVFRENPVLFTGKMISPWIFDDYVYPRPQKQAAHPLAKFEGCPRLYDLRKLESGSVPAVAAV